MTFSIRTASTASSALTLTLVQDAQQRPHDDDVMVGRWTITEQQAQTEGTLALSRNASGLPDQRRRYRVQRVQANPQPWGRLHFTVTRTDRVGNDDFLTFRVHIGTVPSLDALNDILDG